MRDANKKRVGRNEKRKEQNPESSTERTSVIPTSRHSNQLVGGLLILTTFLLCIFPLTDTDFWWHLRTGQLIWERGTVPHSDWFLFTDTDRPWIDLHWGFQLLMTAIYSLGGVNLVIIVKAAVISTAVGISWFATGRGLPNWVQALIWIPAVVCISGRGFERPEMLSQMFLAMWLWIVFRAERQPKWLWMLPAIQLIWINCHALYVLGLAVGACFAVDLAVRFLARGRLWLAPMSSVLSGRTVAGAGTACGVAAFFNPYFLDGALFPFVLRRKFAAEREIYASIGEFQRPFDFFLRLRHGYENVYLDSQILLALLTMASLLTLLVIHRRWSPFRWLLFLAFARLGWDATRNVNIFAIVSATVLTANAADLWQLWFQTPKPVGRDFKNAAEKAGRSEGTTLSAAVSRSDDFSDVHTPLGNLAVAVMLLGWMFLTVTGDWGHWTGERRSFGLGEKPHWFAHEAVQFAGQSGSPDRAFIAHIGIAATYEFHHGPAKKVFLDPRLEVAAPETFLAHEDILKQMSSGAQGWDQLLRDPQGNLPVVILDSRSSRPSINGLLNTPGWVLVYADPAAAVFMAEANAGKLQLKSADPSPLMYPP